MGKVNLDLAGTNSSNDITDELVTDAGSDAIDLVHDRFFGTAALLRIWTGAGETGTQLTLNTDYTMQGLDSTLTAEAIAQVWSQVKIENATYQTGALYFNYHAVADEIDSADHYNIDDVLTLSGDGRVKRHIRIAAPSWRKGTVAPADGFVGVGAAEMIPVLVFDNATDDSVHYNLIVPFRMEVGSTIDVLIDWCFSAADAGTVIWKMEYVCLAEGEAVDTATTTISKTTAGGHTEDTLIRTQLDTGITGAVAHDALAVRLYRDVTDTMTQDIKLIDVHFEFTMNKLGEAI